VSAGRLLATDLDRTLLPNGAQEESAGARPLLAAFVAERELLLAYVTGRRLELVEAAIEEYSLPRPDFVLADVGSSLYAAHATGQSPPSRPSPWEHSSAWAQWLAQDWGGREALELAALFTDVPNLRLQEHEAQGQFKLSFFAPVDAEPETLLRPVRTTLGRAARRCDNRIMCITYGCCRLPQLRRRG